MLKALDQVMPWLGSRKLSQHLLIRRKLVYAFNGDVACTPFPSDINFAPKGKAFYRAIKRCKTTIALWLSPDERTIFIKSGDFETQVECEPVASFPEQLDGEWFIPPKKVKEKVKPPEPVWLKDDYLPHLGEARAFVPDEMSVNELVTASIAQEPLVCDIEIYKNYLLVAFVSVATGRYFYFEDWFIDFDNHDPITQPDLERLRWILEHFLIITFNGNFFDIPILSCILSGMTVASVKEVADLIIGEQVKPWQILRSKRVKQLKINTIDLINVCPLDGSLKLYAGRLHVPTLQDLPFPPDRVLNSDQMNIVRWYCMACDLPNTCYVFVNLKEQLLLRDSMSQQYGIDLRSKSDAQVAEAILNHEIERLTFKKPTRNEIAPGTRYRYQKPEYISFGSSSLQSLLDRFCASEFWIDENGYPNFPTDWPEELTAEINGKTYTLGMGGLHSNETCQTRKADGVTTFILDRDVASYYPAIMLNLHLYPEHLGEAFIDVFKSIRDLRLQAKKNKEKDKAETLKIVVNGTFGKTANKYSTLYSPFVLLMTTITGQLSLLMLIEGLESAGIEVISANTDGVTMYCRSAYQKELSRVVVKAWESHTHFDTEETEYTQICSRDVNTYFALKTDGKIKAKGNYFDPWRTDDSIYERLKNNPKCAIVMEAVIAYVSKGVPLGTTIVACRDVRKFVAIRQVKGGGVYRGQYLGKVVRWYYGYSLDPIVYAKSGNKVPESDGAVPVMTLPTDFSILDVNLARYELEATKVLQEIGLLPSS